MKQRQKGAKENIYGWRWGVEKTKCNDLYQKQVWGGLMENHQLIKCVNGHKATRVTWCDLTWRDLTWTDSSKWVVQPGAKCGKGILILPHNAMAHDDTPSRCPLTLVPRMESNLKLRFINGQKLYPRELKQEHTFKNDLRDNQVLMCRTLCNLKCGRQFRLAFLADVRAPKYFAYRYLCQTKRGWIRRIDFISK